MKRARATKRAKPKPPAPRSRRKKVVISSKPEVVRESPPAAGEALSTARPEEMLAAVRAEVDIRQILVPIDFSIHSKNALKYAVPLAELLGASLHLVFVVEPTVYPADLGFGQVVLPGVEDELREKGGEELRSLLEREIGTKVPATSAVRTGNPHHEILSEAEEKKVDLIVVASHGHSGVEQILFGSTADRIVHSAACPVLTIRPVQEE